jgi:SAM-dependent methyltransferase
MQAEIIDKLLTINREFYQNFGYAFAQTRRRVQPGVRRVLSEWISDGDWLDIGCGSSALAQSWRDSGLRGSYTGIDFSAPLLEEASTGLSGNPPHEGLSIKFMQVDLGAPNWTKSLIRDRYDGIVSFAVLHHIPAALERQRLVRQIAGLLKPGGLFIVSVWQFQHSPKLMARVQPWESAGIRVDEVEAGDTLLDWRHHCKGETDAPGLRYVHLFSRDELAALAEAEGFTLRAEFESDGKGERLGLYQVWRLRGS